MIIGSITLNNLELLEVDQDPRTSIDENVEIGSLAIFNDGGTPKTYQKVSTGINDWRYFPRKNYELRNELIGGSASNAGGQQFTIDLSSLDDIQIGDEGLIYFFKFRGDFSRTNEFLDVLFQGNPYTIGVDGNDSSQIQLDTNGNNQSIPFVVEDIGGGVAGLTFTIDPSNAVNFSPAGMPNGWWWSLLVDLRVGQL